MSNKNLTKTLFADFRKVDTKKLNINGNPFSKVVTDNVPETPTTNDIWKYAVTTDDNGVVTITDDVTVDYTELTDALKDILKTTIKVIDNKVLDANDAVLMNWDTKNFTNKNVFEDGDILEVDDILNIFGEITDEQRTPITEWNSDLSSLTNGLGMFIGTPLQSFSGDLSSLTNGYGMFCLCIALQSFNSNLSSLTNGTQMFYYSALESFSGDLSSLTNGYGMFARSYSLQSFSGNLSSLTNGHMMFGGSALESFSGDLSNLSNGNMMFYSTNLQSFSGDLPSLTNGRMMFIGNPLQSFSGDLSKLTTGSYMFYKTDIESFSGDLSSLTYGKGMFYYSALKSFSGDLSSLIDGSHMFGGTALESFSGDLSSLTDGESMFYNTALQSFSGDLSSLTNGDSMFQRNHPRRQGIKHYKMVDGVKTYVTETFISNGLKSFISNLSSLKSGYWMFGNGNDTTYTYTDDSGSEVTETTKDVVPLNEESIFFIAETINDISSLDTAVDSDWTYTTYDSDGELSTYTIYSDYRGVLHLGYDATTITDTTNIMKYCDEIVAKGWTVYLNGAAQVANNGAIETIPLTDENGSPIAIPYYYKPVQVTDEEIAEYVDGDGNYYIIVGAQHVFGDNISTYGMFTSFEHALQEIMISLNLTKIEKTDEKINLDNLTEIEKPNLSNLFIKK